MIKNFTDFIKESLRDEMKPISLEKIKKNLEGKPYICVDDTLQRLDLNIKDLFTSDEIKGMERNVISYVDDVFGMIVVFPEKIREFLSVGEGVNEIEVSSNDFYKGEYTNEVFITYYENAWGDIDLDEWNDLKNRVEKLVGKNGLEDFDIKPGRMALTLTFNHELPLEEH